MSKKRILIVLPLLVLAGISSFMLVWVCCRKWHFPESHLPGAGLPRWRGYKHSEGYQKCPEFWDRGYARKYVRLWQAMQPETAVEAAILENGVGLFAICDEKKGSFEYWIAGLYKGGDVPEGLKLYAFPESDWAMFSTKGPLPGALQALNTRVWQEWYPTEGQKYIGNGNAMLEVYSPGNMQSPDYECGIWVPVCKPIGQSEQEAAEIVSTMMVTGIL